MQRASSKDVAREAGVSQATVSYVLNNVEGIKIKPETREAVLQAAKKLNYHPNLIAKSMRLKKSMSIGIVTDKNISSFMFMNVLEGIKEALISKNYTMTLCLNKTEDIESAEYIRYYSSNRIDGIIFAFANLTEEQIQYLEENNIPFVMIHTHATTEMIHLVKTDMEEAIVEAVQYLKEREIKEIGFIGPWVRHSGNRRWNGYIKALELQGIPLDEGIIDQVSKTDEEAQDHLKRYFESLQTVPKAIICETANLGFHVLKYAAMRGIRIPEDMSIISIGTSVFAEKAYPSLSTIEAPLYDMGYRGTEMLFDIMKEKRTEEVVVLQWKFIPRSSC